MGWVGDGRVLFKACRQMKRFGNRYGMAYMCDTPLFLHRFCATVILFRFWQSHWTVIVPYLSVICDLIVPIA